MNNKFIKFIIVCAIGIIAITGISILHYFNIGIPCVFYKVTNLYCSGCGITRAIISLLKLDFYQAFRYNPLVIILLPLLLIYNIYIWIFNGKKKLPQCVWVVLLIIVILYGILRNIPLFKFLAPTIVG